MNTAMAAAAPRGLVRSVAIALAGLILGALVARQAVNAWHEPARPEVRTPELLAALDSKTPATTLEKIGAQMMRAIDREPLDSSAYAVLGLIRGREGNATQAEALMRAANRLDHRNGVADIWLANQLARSGHFDEAFVHADAMLRRKYYSTDTYGPLILGYLNDPAAMAAIGRRLALQPPWRDFFFATAQKALKQPEGSIALFDAVVRAGGSITASEMQPVLSQLVQQQRYQQAYLLWLLDSPKEVVAHAGNLINGDFSSVPSAAPFNWVPSDSRFSITDTAAYGRPGSGLRIAFDDTGAVMPLGEQLLALPPGNYRFAGEVMTMGAGSRGHVEWAFVCAPTNADLATTAAPETGGTWRRFESALTVPESCPAQILRARSIPGATAQPVEVWYDSLSIMRQGTPT